MDTQITTLAEACRERAENLYKTRQYLCSEAVVMALNRGFGGSLTDDQAVGLASGFGAGLGDSGCLCGAVSGAVLSLGLFLGETGMSRKNIRNICGEFHKEFRTRHKSTCCRILTKKFREDSDSSNRRVQCACFTGECAELAASLLLKECPALIERADEAYLAQRDSKLGGLVRVAARIMR